MKLKYLMGPSPESPTAETCHSTIIPDEFLITFGHVLADKAVFLQNQSKLFSSIFWMCIRDMYTSVEIRRSLPSLVVRDRKISISPQNAAFTAHQADKVHRALGVIDNCISDKLICTNHSLGYAININSIRATT